MDGQNLRKMEVHTRGDTVQDLDELQNADWVREILSIVMLNINKVLTPRVDSDFSVNYIHFCKSSLSFEL